MTSTKQFYDGFINGMKKFGHVTYSTINYGLLLVVYFFGVGLTSIFAKVLKKHFLEIKISKRVKSYWSDIDLKKKPIEKYYRQF